VISLKGHRIYLDASTIIFAVEALAPNLRMGLLIPLDAGDLQAVTSHLSIVETVVGPRKRGDLFGERELRDFFRLTSNLQVMPVSEAVLEKVIELRATSSLKTPDAIHIATGIVEGCDLFVTADLEWHRAGVQVVDPADVA